jgi:hypothetical protein
MNNARDLPATCGRFGMRRFFARAASTVFWQCVMQCFQPRFLDNKTDENGSRCTDESIPTL